MSLVLQILGGLFLLLLLVIAVVIVVIRQKVRAIVSEMGELASSVPPMRITLVPTDEDTWDDEATVQRYADPLPRFGFLEAGHYLIAEIPGLELLGFVHPEQDIYAAIYEHPAAGVVADFCTRYADGSAITYTTALQGEGLRERPGDEKVHLPEADSERLYLDMLTDRPQGETVPVAPEEFVEVFEQAYADEMVRRLSLGGAGEEEILAIAKQSGMEVSGDDVEATRQLQAMQAMSMLQESLRKHFAEETTMSVAEWERVEDDLTFIHDHMSLEETREWFEDWTGEEPDAWEDVPAAESARELFAALNDRLPADRRLRLIGTVARPIEADAYAPPKEW